VEEVRTLPTRSKIMPEKTGNNRNKDGTFKAGVSGNPNGRPKGSMSIPDMLKRIGEETIPKEIRSKVNEIFDDVDAGEMTLMEGVMRTTMIYAIQGKPWAVQFIADRTEGKAKEFRVVENKNDPIRVMVLEDE